MLDFMVATIVTSVLLVLGGMAIGGLLHAHERYQTRKKDPGLRQAMRTAHLLRCERADEDSRNR